MWSIRINGTTLNTRALFCEQPWTVDGILLVVVSECRGQLLKLLLTVTITLTGGCIRIGYIRT